MDLQVLTNDERKLIGAPKYIEVPASISTDDAGSGLLLELIGLIRRHKGTLMLASSLGLIAALLVSLIQTPIYQAHASLEIQDRNDNFLNMRNISPISAASGSSLSQTDLQTQANILQSESVLESVISKLDLNDKLDPKKNGGHFVTLRKLLGFPALSPESSEAVLHTVSENLKITTEPDTRIIKIYYDSNDPHVAAEVVNTLTSEYIQQNIESRWKTIQQTGAWLSGQMEQVRNKLEKSEDDLQSYAHSSGLLFTSEQTGSQLIENNIDEQKLQQLEEELSKAHADRVFKESKYQLATAAPPESLPEVLGDKTLEDYHVKLTELRRQLAELSTALTPAHPAVRKVQAQIAALDLALGKERANVVQSIRNEYEAAYRRENLLNANYAAQASLVSEQAAKVAHYNILKSDVETNRQLYDSMLRDVQEAAMTSALRASNIRVVDSARQPIHPYKPNLMLNLPLGLLGGAFFGFTYVMMRERADRSIQAPGEAAFSLGIPELGVIPCMSSERGRLFDYYKRKKKATNLQLQNGGGIRSVELITSQNSPSIAADCFRAAVTSVLYSLENGNRPRVIAVTSAGAGEGKTTVASNLALALAETGSSVLLIDGDLRKGRLQEIFQISNSWGLSNLMAGEDPPENQSSRYFETCYDHLHILPTGSTHFGIMSLLHSGRTSEFLNEMRKSFHTIIIDTPPLLHMPDARVLGRLADGVILVVRSAQTTKDQAAAATHRLRADGTRVLGTILNEWDPRKGTSHAGYAQAYRYYQYDTNHA